MLKNKKFWLAAHAQPHEMSPDKTLYVAVVAGQKARNQKRYRRVRRIAAGSELWSRISGKIRSLGWLCSELKKFQPDGQTKCSYHRGRTVPLLKRSSSSSCVRRWRQTRPCTIRLLLDSEWIVGHPFEGSCPHIIESFEHLAQTGAQDMHLRQISNCGMHNASLWLPLPFAQPCQRC